MDIPFSVSEIIQTPMEEFNDLLSRCDQHNILSMSIIDIFNYIFKIIPITQAPTVRGADQPVSGHQEEREEQGDEKKNTNQIK